MMLHYTTDMKTLGRVFIVPLYKQHFEYHSSFSCTIVSQYFFVEFFSMLSIILRFAFKQCLNLNQDRSQCSLELLTVPWRQLGKRLDQLENVATKMLSLERQCIAYVAQCKLSQQFLELWESLLAVMFSVFSFYNHPKITCILINGWYLLTALMHCQRVTLFPELT